MDGFSALKFVTILSLLGASLIILRSILLVTPISSRGGCTCYRQQHSSGMNFSANHRKLTKLGERGRKELAATAAASFLGFLASISGKAEWLAGGAPERLENPLDLATGGVGRAANER